MILNVLFKVVTSVKSVIDVAKSSVCPKMPFPFGSRRDYYSASCVIDVYHCKDVCGKTCTSRCKTQHSQCDRGHLKSDFLFCQASAGVGGDVTLPYSTYEIIEETNVKEGKKPYNRYITTYFHFFSILMVAGWIKL